MFIFALFGNTSDSTTSTDMIGKGDTREEAQDALVKEYIKYWEKELARIWTQEDRDRVSKKHPMYLRDHPTRMIVGQPVYSEEEKEIYGPMLHNLRNGMMDGEEYVSPFEVLWADTVGNNSFYYLELYV